MPREDKARPRFTSRGRRVLRVPIAIKFAGFIAGLLVAAMAWQATIASSAATDSLEREINKGGTMLATALATTLDPDWIVDPGKRDLLLGTLSDFTSSPGAANVLNIVVQDRTGPIATARRESILRMSEGRPIEDPDVAAARVSVREFTYEGMPVRSFARDVDAHRPSTGLGDSGGEARAAVAVGRIEVFVSARQIAESRRRMTAAMAWAAITSCAVAALGALLLAHIMTSPLRALSRDMRQVSLGNLDHESTVRSGDEIGDLAQAFNSMTAGLREAQEVKLAQRALEQELALAAGIQARLLPSSVPQVPGFDVAVHYVPAKEVGGDYYDFVRVDDRRLGVVVADVSGKGVPASLVMTMTRSLLRLAARGESSPARVVEMVNRALTPDLNPGMFVTLVYFVLDPERREIHLVRAGHNAPVLWVARESRIVPIQPRGIGIGLDRQGTLFPSELKVQGFRLEPGDVLVTFTDGVIEAKDPQGADYGDDRLRARIAEVATRRATEIAETLVKDVDAHRRGQEPSDDTTLVVFKAV